MCLGTIYVSFSSWTLFKDCFHLVDKVRYASSSLRSKWGNPDSGNLLFISGSQAASGDNTEASFTR